MSKYEITPIGEWSRALVKHTGEALYGLTENTLALICCGLAPAIYLCALVYFAIEKRVRK